MAPPGPLHQCPHRILMLHALAKAFPGVELIYPTAPIALSANDLPSRDEAPPPPSVPAPVDCWAWWRAREPHGEYVGLEQSLEYISDLLRREGPFDGIVGFSQGAAAAAMVAALLETGRREAFADAHAANRDSLSLPTAVAQLDHPPLRFAVCYSGFSSEHQLYVAFYTPSIATPSLHFIGSLDTVVEESWTQELVARCESGTASVALHPGGHFVPTGKRETAVVIDFIRKACLSDKSQTVGSASGVEDQDVLDMDFPF
ncbi:dihydrofolate reductase [Colletotrichum incanum]|nr:dihydrofolate reductase [Colletotrichum incanum]